MAANQNEMASAGHKLGQLIGDWFENYFVLPLLNEVAARLDLYLDNRFVDRPARGEKIIWRDVDGNGVDYDFVLELDGTDEQMGIPVAFIECFWRRGSRHSKDKARDDSGKLMPMRTTYPTARFLGIVAAGDFTEPARDLVRSREIDLFYVPKDKVVQAFAKSGLQMDYPDTATEAAKLALASTFERNFSSRVSKTVAKSLINLVGKVAVASYIDRVKARLSALPQEIRIIWRHEATPIVFRSVNEVADFLNRPVFAMDNPQESYVYQVTYSDGTGFETTVNSIADLQGLNGQVQRLSEHMANL